MTRAEHLVWAKKRALEYLPGDPNGAMASFQSDLGKHEELDGHAVIMLMMMFTLGGALTADECRKQIEGTN